MRPGPSVPGGTKQRLRRLDPETDQGTGADEESQQGKQERGAKVHAEVAQEAAGLVPFHPERAGPAAAGMMDGLHVRSEVDRDPRPVQPEAEIEIVNMQKVAIVHAAHGAEGRGRQHHARAADGRYAGGAAGERMIMVVESVMAEKPRC